jgi:hypothetical protein
VNALSLTRYFFPNVFGDVIQYLGICIVSSFLRPLVAQKIFPQVMLRDLELAIRLASVLPNHSVLAIDVNTVRTSSIL